MEADKETTIDIRHVALYGWSYTIWVGKKIVADGGGFGNIDLLMLSLKDALELRKNER